MLGIGIDTGGTFTDFVVTNEVTGETFVFKVPSTPKNPTNAIIEGFKKIKNKENADLLIHGTTVGTNAIIERKGPKIALITTKNFEDVIEIGRQKRPKLYDLEVKRPVPLVTKEMRIGVNERIGAHGEIIEKLTDEEINNIIKNVLEKKPESIAISLLFSFKKPEHEIKLKTAIQEEIGIPVSISYEVLPEFREFERTSTTVIDAFLKPIISEYLEILEKNLRKNAFHGVLSIFKSDAGISFPSTIKKRPSELLLSGLAGGIKAAQYTSKVTGWANLISIDIGGTSTDVGIIVNGKEEIKKRTEISGLVNGLPVVDVETIGAGGGSLARLVNGFFKVGPESAGSEPGPACYGKGNKIPTVTDADVVTGRLHEENFAGGTVKLYSELAFKAVSRLAEELGTDTKTTAEGIQQVYQNNIISALRKVSIERGYNPKEFALLAFGGQGPVHAAELGEKLGVNAVIIPPYPGTWSALGLLTAEHRYERSKSVFLEIENITYERLMNAFEELKATILETIKYEGISLNKIVFEYYLEMRFEGQGYEMRIKWEHEKEDLRQLRHKFLENHMRKYGFTLETPVKIINIVLVANSQGYKLKISKPQKRKENEKLSPAKNVTIFYNNKDQDASVFYKKNIMLEDKIVGPSIILQPDTTIFVPPGWYGELTETMHLILRRRK